MKARSRIVVVATMALLMVWNASAQTATVDLQQNWSPGESQKFWFTSQGSRLMPYSWFLALEQTSSSLPFRDPANMRRLGYIPVAASTLNPDALPIGFVKDIGVDGTEAVGFTCAACHTSELRLNSSTSVIVEGAPALADFASFINELVAAMEATLNTQTKFDAFSKQVSKPNEDLKAHLQDKISDLRRRWLDHPPATPYGPARLDAFGGLYNQVVAYDLVPSNAHVANAPVSYPFLWDTPQHDKVQWNGSGNNDIFGYGPIFRNIGEALGVFGEVDLKPKEDDSPSYRSSLHVDKIIELEELIKRLQSPVWPENVLKIDHTLAAEGAAVYKTSCSRCHRLIERTDLNRKIKAKMKDAGTDKVMAANFAMFFNKKQGAETGVLKGTPKTFVLPLGLGRFGQEAKGGEIFTNAILGTYRGRQEATFVSLVSSRPVTAKALDLEISGSIKRFRATIEEAKAVYKARPLDGIWATAPYLHNGSVPNLHELLRAKRVPQFYVGSHDFDAKNVGLSTEAGSGNFLFDTSLPGNSNLGHTYGTSLPPDKKEALLEFLKTL